MPDKISDLLEAVAQHHGVTVRHCSTIHQSLKRIVAALQAASPAPRKDDEDKRTKAIPERVVVVGSCKQCDRDDVSMEYYRHRPICATCKSDNVYNVRQHVLPAVPPREPGA